MSIGCRVGIKIMSVGCSVDIMFVGCYVSIITITLQSNATAANNCRKEFYSLQPMLVYIYYILGMHTYIIFSFIEFALYFIVSSVKSSL